MEKQREKSIRFELELLSDIEGLSISEEDIESIVSEVDSLNLPCGLDVYYSLYVAVNGFMNPVLKWFNTCDHSKPIEDNLIYLYTKDAYSFNYDELNAYILKRSLMYCVPF